MTKPQKSKSLDRETGNEYLFQLPKFSYFSIPPFLLLSLYKFYCFVPKLVQGNFRKFTLSAGDIVLSAISALLIGIPVLITMGRPLFASFFRLRIPERKPFDFASLHSMFRLPDSISKSHRWFVPVYYGSFVVYFCGTIVILIWRSR